MDRYGKEFMSSCLCGGSFCSRPMIPCSTNIATISSHAHVALERGTAGNACHLEEVSEDWPPDIMTTLHLVESLTLQ